jgi:endonuclease/exonuclease/phosphatase (EEP) superfamily protein YafD
VIALSRLPILAAATLLALTVAGACGEWHWLLDLTSHFRWYWMLAAAAGLAASLRWPRSPACVMSGLALLGNAWAMLPFWMPPGSAAGKPALAAHLAADAEPPLSLVMINVRRVNRETARTLDYLRGLRADVAVIIEIDGAWEAALESLADLYPHRVVRPRDDNFGIGVFSRWPLRDAEIVSLGGTPYPNVLTRVAGDGGEWLLVATHPFPPFTPALGRGQRLQLAAVAARVAAATLPCVVAGDFNATPWSAAYREFTAASGLVDTASGRGVQPTWNARLPAPRIPIDHVFVSHGVRIARRAVGPDVGSDHFPVEVELVLPAGKR